MAEQTRASKIREFILNNVEKHPRDIVGLTAERFAVSRMTVHRHITTLINQGKLFKSGTTNNAVYSLKSSIDKTIMLPISPTLSESEVWDEHFAHLKSELPENVYNICEYGVTEMVNNAIDHSEGKLVGIRSKRDGSKICFSVYDDGIGIFKKIKNALRLKDEREAVLQLSKGKLTTDPKRHSGEGIFFSSRLFDCFEILANGLFYLKDNDADDWFLENRTKQDDVSTLFAMEIDINSKRKAEEIFKKYADQETHVFDSTHILVNLSLSNEERFVSRSQAKRILVNLEKFKHIVLDFRGVHSVGQAFVDEVFRVFKAQHPDVTIVYVNANENVKFMIERGIATARENTGVSRS